MKMNCNKAHTKLIFLAEGSLSAEMKQDLLLHISVCEDCKQMYSLFLQMETQISIQKAMEPSAWFDSVLSQKIENISNLKTKDLVPKIKPQWVYAFAIGFAVISAFVTGYFIGNNNYQYINSSSQSVQKTNVQNSSENGQEAQYETAFSLY